MLNLEVQSRKDPEALIDKAVARFADEEGMGVTEFVSHLHQDDQALDVTITNIGNPEEARGRIDSIVDFARTQYGYQPARFLLHFDDTGNLGRHVVVDLEYGNPHRVTFQSDKADEVVRAFANTIT